MIGGFRSICRFLYFCGQPVVAVIMIDSSKKRNSLVGVEVLSPYVIERRSNIQTEFDLHKKVVNFIRNHYPKALLNATLGENQINSDMRLRSYNLGYQKGSPDLIIQNLHKVYSGFAIEFKSPRGYGELSEHQNVMLQEYTNNGFKVLVSNDYDEIIKEIIHYFDGVRIKCNHCSRKFKSSETLKNHSNYIHRYINRK